MSRWQAVVFDLDDTLYPEREYVRGGFRAVGRWASEALGEAPQDAADELWALFESGARKDTFDRWLRTRGLETEPHRAAMINAYRRHRPSLAPYPDVVPALSALRGRVRLGLITEGRRDAQLAKLEALALEPWFDKIVVMGEEERADWKPSRVPFDRWLEGGDVPPDAALYVGDNPAKDFRGARGAGWASLRVRRSDGLHRSEEHAAPDAQPDGEIPDLASLASFLDGVEVRRR